MLQSHCSLDRASSRTDPGDDRLVTECAEAGLPTELRRDSKELENGRRPTVLSPFKMHKRSVVMQDSTSTSTRSNSKRVKGVPGSPRMRMALSVYYLGNQSAQLIGGSRGAGD